jgi:hypothetical protein
MIIRGIDLKARNLDSALTEIMFEIAGAKADGCELARINIIHVDGENDLSVAKLYDGVIKILKNMKAKKLLQFYAVKESFEKPSTEGRFLINKYPDISTEGEGYWIYVKL